MTSILNLDGTPVKNFSDPNRKVKWSKPDIYGDPVYGSLRSIAHLDKTSKQAEKRFGQEIEVIQGAYNTDIAASAGTHDKDAVYDVFIPNVDWWAAQRFLRFRGWAAWYRYPPTFGSHIHMISLGYQTEVGDFVPGQVSDYRAHRDGLASHAFDPSVHPADIDSTIFHFKVWEKEMSTLNLDKDDKAWLKEMVQDTVNAVVGRELPQLVEEVVSGVLTAPVNAEGDTVRAALRSARNTPPMIRDLGKELDAAVSEPTVKPEDKALDNVVE